ncbi:uncharacterized protein GLRG_01781 [Colletotrichum graminicola M1.001]|uniref:Uncharacterized protein n=1 Tax=Colletotrichum graminicola (strain M1.001 / M2 / FGSC 10212) TaxID=645133 RepID=E3Q9A7_COLGM|nr:uncharacterized protein GLRG_01781 [Colletotrichum graminicola M1.001]EFQ27286.1 hypothetical protein GLRG_01781 [Colletotrichum graminicola M1.001]
MFLYNSIIVTARKDSIREIQVSVSIDPSQAIPAITDEFHSLQDIGWYGSAYQVADAAFQPLMGTIVAGVGSAGIMSGGLTIIVGSVPLEKRPGTLITVS